MFIWKHECQATTLPCTKERENAQKCDDPASLEKEKKNNQKKTKFKNLVVKLQLGYLAIFSNHIIYFDISEPLQF